MWVPVRIEQFIEAVISHLDAIQKAIQERTAATNQAQEASSEEWRQIPRIISSIIDTSDKSHAECTKQEESARKTEQQPLVDSQIEIAKWTKRACIAAVAYGLVAFWQGCLIRGQLDQMIQATNATVKASDAANDSFEATYGEKGTAERTMGQMIDQTIAQIQSAQAAEKAIKATQQQMRLDERAWLVSTGSFLGNIEDGKSIPFSVAGTNTGKTPGRKATIATHVTFSGEEITKEGELSGPERPPSSVGVIAPNSTFSGASDEIPASDVPTIKARLGDHGCTYVWGDIEYRDIFRTKHITEFCSYRCLRQGYETLRWCKFHNEAN